MRWVSDNIGVAAAVALTATYNKTQANIGSGVTVSDAGDVEVSATSRQNRGTDFQKTMSAEAVSGASGGDVAVAGSLALVGNYNETQATIDEGATIGTSGAPVGDVSVKSDDTSKVSAQARAGALSTGGQSKTGVGASFAVLLSYNKNTAAVGYDANKNGAFPTTNLYADSLTVTSTKNRVRMIAPTFADAVDFVKNDAKNLDFDALDPSTYLGIQQLLHRSHRRGRFQGQRSGCRGLRSMYGNTTAAYLGHNVNATVSGKQAAGEQPGVEVAARADTQAIAFGRRGRRQEGWRRDFQPDIVNLDETRAEIGAGSDVRSPGGRRRRQGDGRVEAGHRQCLVSAGASTGNAGSAACWASWCR